MGLFEALACGNAYPSLYYSEREWNALIMKAVFVGADLHRVLGLARRLSPELSRMALDYVDEREAAARAVPPALWDLIGHGAPAPALGRLIGYLNHSQAEHRAGAARALARLGDLRAASFLEERAALEAEPSVAAVVHEAIASLKPRREGITERSA
jgi:hypothetical protein